MDMDLLTIGEVSTRSFLKLSKNDSLYNALKELRKQKTDRALIYDDDSLIGIITKKDVVRKIPIAKSKYKRIPISQLHLSSIMSSPVITLPHNALVLKAARIMLEKNISSIPVIKDSQVTALFTKWNIANLMVESTVLVKDIATYPVKVISKYSSIIYARRLIIDEGISTLPVIDDRNNLVGILTVDELTDALVDLINILAEGGSKEGLRHIGVGEIMRPFLPKVRNDDTVGKAASLILSEGVRGVVVVDESDKISGIITLTDLTKFFAGKTSTST